LLLDLVDDADLITAYRAWHAPGRVPKAVIASIQQQGIMSMEIWNFADRLVMVVEEQDDVNPAASSHIDISDPDVMAWEALMDGFQRRLACAAEGVKWVAAEKIFDLSDHLSVREGPG
jgi:L-rhamnose mutarotase